MSTQPLRVVIADDQSLVRAGFRMILETEDDLTVVAEAGNGEEAVDLARRHAPDVVLMDIRMPDLDGLGDQVEGYGVGLTAYYAALLRRRPGVLPALLRLAPAALGYLRGGGDGPGGLPTDLPAGLLRRQRRGMLAGPLRYLRSRRTQARAAVSPGPSVPCSQATVAASDSLGGTSAVSRSRRVLIRCCSSARLVR